MPKIALIFYFLGLLSFGFAGRCPKQKTSPGREVLCYTTTFDAGKLNDVICRCTTLVHQGHDIRDLSGSGIGSLRTSLKDMNPAVQFVLSVGDPTETLRTSATVRQEAGARLAAILKEVDGVELNVTAGSKERLAHFVKDLKNELVRKSNDKRILMALPTKAEILAKQFDLKELSKYVDLFTVSTHYLIDNEEAFHTFHPSRLMGLFDMLNTDSLVDLIHGLGLPKDNILIKLPASAYKFTLTDKEENTPRSSTEEKEPAVIDRNELCGLMKNGEWTIERDEDLTAPYAFQNRTWIAFEDKISVGIKGKYVLLRNLAGIGIENVENDMKTDCGKALTQEVYHSFMDFKRQTRQAVLSSLEDDIHQNHISYPNHVKSSGFRVVRVVDTEGKIRAVRENMQTEFSCTRQGFFVHPRSCNRFYRCVKFNQEVEDYSVFEFDCPAGLAFDERTEVCVWPASLPQGSPCPGSSEIAPVTRVKFQCPSQPGYYVDPQNCRWFYACIDLGGPELMGYEFRCPYGLVFDEHKLSCEWPWLVPGCSESGSGYTRTEYAGGVYNHGGFGYSDGIGGHGGNSGGYDQGSTNGYYSGGSAFSGTAGINYGSHSVTNDGHFGHSGQTTSSGYSGQFGSSNHDNSGLNININLGTGRATNIGQTLSTSAYAGDYSGSGLSTNNYGGYSGTTLKDNSIKTHTGGLDGGYASTGLSGTTGHFYGHGQGHVTGYQYPSTNYVPISPNTGGYGSGSTYTGGFGTSGGHSIHGIHATTEKDYSIGTNIYQGHTGLTDYPSGYGGEGLNITIIGNQVPSIGSTFHQGGVGSGGYTVGISNTGSFVTGNGIQGSAVTGNSLSGTVLAHGGVSGSVYTGAAEEGTIVTGSNQPGYVKHGTGTPSYTINDGAKTIYSGSIHPSTVSYGSTAPGIILSGTPVPPTIIEGHNRPSYTLHGQTSPGTFIGGSTADHSFSNTGSTSYYGNTGFVKGGSVRYPGTVSGGFFSKTGPSEDAGYKTTEYYDDTGHSTVKFNNGYVTNKYTEKDLPDIRPPINTLPDSILPDGGAGKVNLGTFTPSGFTKTGPTKTGFTTAVLGGRGTYVSSTTQQRPTLNYDNIGEKAFEGNVAGYTKSSTKTFGSTDNYSHGFSGVTPGIITTTEAPDVNHIDVSKITLGPSVTPGYSYPKPSIPFNTNTVHLSSTTSNPTQSNNVFVTSTTPAPILNVELYNRPTLFDSAPITNKPVAVNTYSYNKPTEGQFRETTFESGRISTGSVSTNSFHRPIVVSERIPITSTEVPAIYTSGSLDDYKTTIFEAAKIPITASTVQPVKGISSGYSYPKPKVTFNTGLPSATSYHSTTKTYEPQYISSTTTAPAIGVTYKKPFPVSGVNYTPSSYGGSTGYSYSNQGYTQTKTTLGSNMIAGGAIDFGISKEETDKLMTNYNRGTVRYTPSVFNGYNGNGIDATGSVNQFSNKQSTFSSSSSYDQNRYGSRVTASEKTPAITTYLGSYSKTPSSTPHYEIATKPTTEVGKGKIVVKWSDLHPLLLNKLGAECTCKSDPFATLRGPGKNLISSSRGKVDISNYDESDIYVDLENDKTNVYDDETNVRGSSTLSPVFKIGSPAVSINGEDSSLNFKGSLSSGPSSTTYLPSRSTALPSTAIGGFFESSTAHTSQSDFSRSLKEDNNIRSAISNRGEITYRAGIRSGKKLNTAFSSNSVKVNSFEKNQPNGLSAPVENLQGVSECARPGLFRHPTLCNKFYACHWDEWKKKYTLHVFNCPVHLTFDSSASACNWPSKGPSCQDGNLLV